MSAETVTVRVGGANFTAWEDVSLKASCRDATRSFTLRVACEIGRSALFQTFRAGASVEILAGSDRVLVGYVDRSQPKIGPRRYELTVTGRSKSQDLVDCAAIHPTGSLTDVTIEDVGRALDAFGVGIRAAIALEKIPKVQIVPGLTVFQTLEPMARAAGRTLMGAADGSLVIWDASKAKKHEGVLLEGANIEEATADHDMSGRHSRYIVKGQRPWGSGPDAMEIEAVARDAGVDRDRPAVIVVEEDTDKARVKTKAKNRRDKAAGKGLSASIRVATWRDTAGALWEPGKLVWVESPSLWLAQDMLIETIDLRQTSARTDAMLHLVDPRAHGGKAGKGRKSGKSWEQDDSEARE